MIGRKILIIILIISFLSTAIEFDFSGINRTYSDEGEGRILVYSSRIISKKSAIDNEHLDVARFVSMGDASINMTDYVVIDFGADDYAEGLFIHNNSIYLAGTTNKSGNFDFLVLILNYTLDVISNITQDLDGHNDKAFDIAVNDSGDIYIAGESIGYQNNKDARLLKLLPNGTLLWHVSVGYWSAYNSVFRALVIGDDDYIYVTGREYRRPGFMLEKFDSNGSRIKEYEVVGDVRYPNGYGLGYLDNYIYIVGYGTGYDNSYYGRKIIKFNTNLANVWERSLARYCFHAITIDNINKYIYVAGEKDGFAFVAKYDTSGNVIWVYCYDVGVAKSIAFDNFGSVFVLVEISGENTTMTRILRISEYGELLADSTISIYDHTLLQDIAVVNCREHEEIIAVGYVRNESTMNDILVMRFNTTSDVLPPRLNITSPEDGTLINSTDVFVSWSAFDYLGIDHFEAKIDDGDWIDLDLNFNHTFSGLSQGWHRIYVKAVDKSGFETVKYVDVFIDLIDPEIRIVYPSNGTYLNITSVNVSWNASDNFGLAYFQVSIDYGPWINVGYSFWYIVDLSTEGFHRIIVRVYDEAGNFAESLVGVTVDLTPPFIKILQPNNDSLHLVDDVNVSWTASDNEFIDHIEVYVDGRFYSGLYAWMNSIEIENLSDGMHKISVVVYDAADNKNESSIIIYIDILPPEIIIEHPSNNSYININEITVSWYAYDFYGIDHYEISFNGTTWIDIGHNTSIVYNAVIGENVIYIKAIDTNGYENTYKLVFVVDMNPPSLAILSPQDNDVLNSGQVELIIDANDDFGIKTCRVFIDGEPAYESLDDIYYLNLTEGPHSILVVVDDYAGNSNSQSISIVIDQEPPNISIGFKNSSYIRKNVVQWYAWDNYDLSLVEIYVNGTLVVSTEMSFGEVNLSLGNGIYIIEFKIYDKAQNTITRKYLLKYDDTPPEIAIREPENNTKISAPEVHLEIDVSDNFLVKNVSIYIDGKLLMATNNTHIDMTISLDSPGSIVITILALDEAENRKMCWIYIEYIVPTVIWERYTVYIAIVFSIIVAVIIVFALKKRKTW